MLRFEWSKAVKRPSPVVLWARRRGPRSPWTRFVPRLDPMEDRTLLSTVTVLNNHDSEAGSLRQAIHDANSGDTIVFAKSVHAITLTSGELKINNKSLDIEGPGANRLTISGGGVSRVFDIKLDSGTVTVTIAGLTVANGLATSTGNPGAQLGEQLGGGGILNNAGATLNLTRCSVVNNEAVASPGLDVFGGGLLNLGTANVTYSTFTGNQVLGGGTGDLLDPFSGSVGGGIDNFGGATLIVTGSTFIYNQAISAEQSTPGTYYYGIGGAIDNNAGFNQAHPSTATISNSTFTDNQARGLGDTSSGNGGAIDNLGTDASMTVTNSTFIGNQAIGGDGNAGVGGGILNSLGSTLKVTSSTFMGNQAKGASVFGGGINNTSAELTVIDSSFFGNKALALGTGGIALGGGIFNGAIAGLATLELNNCTLSGNQAIGGAGGVAAGGGLDNSFGATATIEDSQIINNQALGGAGDPGVNGGVGGDGVGGGISVGSGFFFDFNDNASITVSNSVIASNTARGGKGGSGAKGGDGLGGGIWFGSDSTGTLDNSVITGNFALGGRPGAAAAPATALAVASTSPPAPRSNSRNRSSSSTSPPPATITSIPDPPVPRARTGTVRERKGPPTFWHPGTVGGPFRPFACVADLGTSEKPSRGSRAPRSIRSSRCGDRPAYGW